jgi:hypothetical protein
VYAPASRLIDDAGLLHFIIIIIIIIGPTLLPILFLIIANLYNLADKSMLTYFYTMGFLYTRRYSETIVKSTKSIAIRMNFLPVFNLL